MRMIIDGDNAKGIIKEQYYLSRKANIGLMESSLLPLFEKDVILGFLTKDVQEEAESLSNFKI